MDNFAEFSREWLFVIGAQASFGTHRFGIQPKLNYIKPLEIDAGKTFQ